MSAGPRERRASPSGGGEAGVTTLPRHTLRLFRPPAVRRHVEGEEPYGRLLEPTPGWIDRIFWLVIALASAGAVAALVWLP